MKNKFLEIGFGGTCVAAGAILLIQLMTPSERVRDKAFDEAANRPEGNGMAIEKTMGVTEERPTDSRPASIESADVEETSVIDPAELTARQRAEAFFELMQRDRTAALAWLESGADWVDDEKFGLSAVLLEDVAREDPDQIAVWLDRLGGYSHDRETLIEGWLQDLVATPDLFEEPFALLRKLAQNGDHSIAGAARLTGMLDLLENDGFAAALEWGQASGVTVQPDDAQLEVLVGQALQSNPVEVLAALETDDRYAELASAYTPFVLSQGAWQSAENPEAWRQSLVEHPLEDIQ